MIKRKTQAKFRKAHRYLGLFLGVQFLMWTISGMYFSWTDIDEIHGDHFKNEPPVQRAFTGLLGSKALAEVDSVRTMRLLGIAGTPYYWVNKNILVNAKTGASNSEISQEEALKVAARYVRPDYEVSSIERIEEVGNHHEYRGRPLPAYVISYATDENLKSYVAAHNGEFQTVRHRDWRWFDFLWMTHTMDYEGRDDFNTWVLRIFSLLGLVTVLSGFALWYVSSPTAQNLVGNNKKKSKKKKVTS